MNKRNYSINLVSGGSGFIGSHLIDKLMERGEKVICLDNFSTGKIENLAKWKNNKRLIFISQDVMHKIKERIKVDRIWHLACPASPLKYQKDPINTSKIIFNGTLNMLDIAKRENAKILFASSSEIYGNPMVHPQEEEYFGNVALNSKRSCYEEGKRIAETLCNDFKRKYNLKIKIPRIFNTYGPRMLPNDGRVISNFIYQSLNNKQLTVYGNGNQTRSFCYIEDLIEGLLKFMESSYTGTINMGNPEEIKIKDLAKLIISKINPNLGIKYSDQNLDEPLQRKPIIEKAKKEINWSPKISLSEGLDKTIKNFKDIIGNE